MQKPIKMALSNLNLNLNTNLIGACIFSIVYLLRVPKAPKNTIESLSKEKKNFMFKGQKAGNEGGVGSIQGH